MESYHFLSWTRLAGVEPFPHLQQVRLVACLIACGGSGSFLLGALLAAESNVSSCIGAFNGTFSAACCSLTASHCQINCLALFSMSSASICKAIITYSDYKFIMDEFVFLPAEFTVFSHLVYFSDELFE